MKQTIILGNIITIDEKRPFAKAALVQNGLFAYIGNAEEAFYQMEVAYVGQELADQAYPIKSFYDAGANVVFHSDYPVSPMLDISCSIYMAQVRAFPEKLGRGGIENRRNTKEAITREQSLRAMTINVARQWRQEHRMGSIEFGKIANMTVFDCDFLHDDIDRVAQANIIATIVDGEEVYNSRQ